MKGTARTVIIILVIFAIALIILTFLWPSLTGAVNKTEFISIPVVSVPVNDSNGASHNVSVGFSFEVLPKDMSSIDTVSVSRNIGGIVTDLSYDEIVSEGGSDYLKANVMRGLELLMDMSKVKGVYVTDLQAGNPNLFPSEQTTPGMEKIKGLFQNIK